MTDALVIIHTYSIKVNTLHFIAVPKISE